jgi:hypothetical protein
MADGHMKLSDFLNKLAEDPALQAEYEADPDAVMARFNLAPGHRKILKDGKLGPIREALDAEGAGAAVFLVIKRPR